MNEDNSVDCVSVADFQAVVQFLFQRINLLEDLVENQLIGGIKGLYDNHTRETGISGLKSKYGEKFGSIEHALPSLGIPNWAETLFDELKSMKEGSEDWDEEKEGGYVESGIQQLLSRINAITGVKPDEASVTVVKKEGDLPVEEVKEEEAPKAEEPKDLASILNAMKAKSRLD